MWTGFRILCLKSCEVKQWTLSTGHWTVRHNKTQKLMVASGFEKFCSFISIHIGPAVSFTLGWVGDVPGIIFYIEISRLLIWSIEWPFLLIQLIPHVTSTSKNAQISTKFLEMHKRTIRTPCMFGTWWRQRPISRIIFEGLEVCWTRMHPSIDWLWGIFAICAHVFFIHN